MPDQYQLTSIVRKLDPAQRHVVAADGFVVTLGEGFFAKKSYYLVTTPRDDQGSARVKSDVTVEAPVRHWQLQFDVILTLHFSGSTSADAHTLVDAVCDGDNPDQAFSALVRHWVQDFIRDSRLTNDTFVATFLSVRDALRTCIINAAARLALKVTSIDLTIRGEEAVPDVLELRLPNVPVVLQDYKPDVYVSLDVDLRRSPGSILPYVARQPDDAVKAAVRRQLRDRYRSHITLHGFQYDTAGAVHTVTRDIIGEIAQSLGRDIDRVIITPHLPVINVSPTIEFKLSQEKFKQLDYPDPVQVDVDLKVTLVNLGRFVASGIDPKAIDGWLTVCVRDAIARHLLGVNYVDLFPQFDQKLKDTREALAASVRSIGYEISRFVLQTNLDFHVLQRGFHCRIENARFPLKLRECEVLLDIEALLRITDKEQLQKLFSQNTAITQTISTTVHDAVASKLRDVSPEEFYLRFNGMEGQTGQSVAEQLEVAIQDACKPFGPLPGMKVNITQRADELMGVYSALVRSEVQLSQLRDPNSGLAVDVKVSVNSIAVQHWRQFQERKPTIDQVRASVALHVVSFLNEYAGNNLRDLVKKSGPVVARLAEQWIGDRLAEEYGLRIHIDHWFLIDPILGSPLVTWEDTVKSFNEALGKLTKELSRALVDGDSELATDLKTRMKKVTQMRDALFMERGARGSILTAAEQGYQFPVDRGGTKQLDGAADPKILPPGRSD